MMTRIAKEELNKIKPKIEKIDEYHYKINKQVKIVIELIEGHIYLIRLEDYILHPSDNFTLATNWNAGVIPKSSHILGELKKRMGKMLQFDGIGYDIGTGNYKEDIYKGLWLPQSGVEIIKEVDRDDV